MTHLTQTATWAVSALALTAAALAAPNTARADSQPFVGEIAQTGVTGYCPSGWASTDGQLLAIADNDALFSLLGTTFGGDGRTSFGLPDLRGRHPIGAGTGPGLQPRVWGQKAGTETASLNLSQLASHNHLVNATNADGDKPGPGGKILAAAPTNGTGAETIYSDQPLTVQMSAAMIAPTGSSRPVSIVDPASVIRYCISLFGVYPSRS